VADIDIAEILLAPGPPRHWAGRRPRWRRTDEELSVNRVRGPAAASGTLRAAGLRTSPAQVPPPTSTIERTCSGSPSFAVLRRPPTAAERAAVRTFTTSTDARPLVPEYVRLAGVANRVRVYLVVYPISRHGATGPTVAHQMNVIAGSGNPYAPSNYLIFPTEIGGSGQQAAYLSIVPDGVQSVRWRFMCGSRPDGARYVLPAQRVVNLSVHNNMAVLPLPAASPGDLPCESVDGDLVRD
jgi:hypothetical protein